MSLCSSNWERDAAGCQMSACSSLLLLLAPTEPDKWTILLRQTRFGVATSEPAHRGSKIAGRHSGAQIGRALISPSLLLQVIVQSLKAAFHRFLRCLPREGECCHHHGRLILNRGREQWEHNATAAPRRPLSPPL